MSLQKGQRVIYTTPIKVTLKVIISVVICLIFSLRCFRDLLKNKFAPRTEFNRILIITSVNEANISLL